MTTDITIKQVKCTTILKNNFRLASHSIQHFIKITKNKVEILIVEELQHSNYGCKKEEKYILYVTLEHSVFYCIPVFLVLPFLFNICKNVTEKIVLFLN